MLARTLETAGYRQVRSACSEIATDATVIENLVMFYDEVRDALQSMGIMNAEEIDRQQRLLRALPPGPLPAAWCMHRVVCEA